jgi:hypothetical protein
MRSRLASLIVALRHSVWLAPLRKPLTLTGDLIVLSFPHQLIHALSALRHRRALRGSPDTDPVTIFVWSHQPYEHSRRSRTRRILDALLPALPQAHFLFPGLVARISIWSPHAPVLLRITAARAVCRHPPRAVYYAHDISDDHTAQVLLQAFPCATAVCFGDPPGFLYPPVTAPGGLTWPARQGGVPRQWRNSDERFVAVDIAQGPQEPKQLIPGDVLRGTLAALTARLPTAREAQCALIGTASSSRRIVLLVLSNFTESRLTHRTAELALYEALVRQQADVEDIIWIKPHFGSNPAVTVALQARMPEYNIRVLPEPLRWLPLEFLDVLLQRAQVLSVSSASVLLASLYGNARVLHVISADIIRDYFIRERQKDFTEANCAIIEALEACGAPACKPIV